VTNPTSPPATIPKSKQITFRLFNGIAAPFQVRPHLRPESIETPDGVSKFHQ
jgi:hypothetical protein